MCLPHLNPLSVPDKIWQAVPSWLPDTIVGLRRDLYCRKYGHLWSVGGPACLWCGAQV